MILLFLAVKPARTVIIVLAENVAGPAVGIHAGGSRPAVSTVAAAVLAIAALVLVFAAGARRTVVIFSAGPPAVVSVVVVATGDAAASPQQNKHPDEPLHDRSVHEPNGKIAGQRKGRDESIASAILLPDLIRQCM